MSSLCALSDMQIITKHESAEVGTKLDLNQRGEIVKQIKCPRQTGTTVIMQHLFESLPVRKREFQKNIKREFAKMCQILQGYGLIGYGCRIIVSNQSAKGARTTILSTNGSHSMMDNIVAVFGPKQKCNLLEIQQPFEGNETLTQEMIKSLDASFDFADGDVDSLGLNRFRFEGYISSCGHGCGRSSRDRQYFFINGRPCEPKQIIKLINDTYHRYNMQQSPFVALNVIVERKDVDVNITKDKRQVLVNNETILRLALKKSLLSTFGQIPSTFKMQNTTNTSLREYFKGETTSEVSIKEDGGKDDRDDENETKSQSDDTSIDEDFDKRVVSQKGDPTKFANVFSQWCASGQTEGDATTANINLKRRIEPDDDIPKMCFKMKKIQEYLSQEMEETSKKYSYKSESDDSDGDPTVQNRRVKRENESSELEESFDVCLESRSNDVSQAKAFQINCKVKAIDSPKVLKVQKANRCETEEQKSIVVDDSTAGTTNFEPNHITTINSTLEEISELAQRESQLRDEENHRVKLNRLRFKAKIDPNKNKAAEQELSTEISKNDFCKMEIIGQFNLGFIVVRLDNDLFIVDQHATDEKYNFETLQKMTILQHQKLVLPQNLELTAVNEMILIDNLNVFEMNGFRFEIDMERPVTQRVKLMAKPVSKNWEFGKEDIDELIFMLQDGCGDPSSISSCRPSRVRNMFASRACRTSVMIGTSLSRADMRRLVDQMGTIEQPWVCPRYTYFVSNFIEFILTLFPNRIVHMEGQQFGTW